MALKLPPPPPIANTDPAFNRWLIEITSILSNSGGIDPNTINGYAELQNQVAENTAALDTFGPLIDDLTGSVNALQSQINVLQNDVVAINMQLTALGARAQVYNGTVDPDPGLGNVNDWYANFSGAAGHRIFIKTAAATWTAFPF